MRGMSLWQLADRLHVYGRMPRPLALPLAVALRAFAWVRRVAAHAYTLCVHVALLPALRVVKWAVLLHPKSQQPLVLSSWPPASSSQPSGSPQPQAPRRSPAPSPVGAASAAGRTPPTSGRPDSDRLFRGPGSGGGGKADLHASGSGGRSGGGSSWDGGDCSFRTTSSGLCPSASGADTASAGDSFQSIPSGLRPGASGAGTAGAVNSSFKAPVTGLHPSSSGAEIVGELASRWGWGATAAAASKLLPPVSTRSPAALGGRPLATSWGPAAACCAAAAARAGAAGRRGPGRAFAVMEGGRQLATRGRVEMAVEARA
jgi:hypothetical protein